MKISAFDLKPSTIVLLIGINDINTGRDVDDIAITYREILNEIKNNFPNTIVYCISVLPLNYDLERYSNSKINVDDHNIKVIELKKQILNLSNEFKYTYIDLYSKVIDMNNLLFKDYSDDGIHLNNNGFSVWTNEMIKYLK